MERKKRYCVFIVQRNWENKVNSNAIERGDSEQRMDNHMKWKANEKNTNNNKCNKPKNDLDLRDNSLYLGEEMWINDGMKNRRRRNTKQSREEKKMNCISWYICTGTYSSIRVVMLLFLFVYFALKRVNEWVLKRINRPCLTLKLKQQKSLVSV